MLADDIGRLVTVAGRDTVGVLRFYGAVGGDTVSRGTIMCGIELDKELGEHNGTVDGVEYFKCADRHGLMCSPDAVRLCADEIPGVTSSSDPPSST